MKNVSIIKSPLWIISSDLILTSAFISSLASLFEDDVVLLLARTHDYLHALLIFRNWPLLPSYLTVKSIGFDFERVENQPTNLDS